MQPRRIIAVREELMFEASADTADGEKVLKFACATQVDMARWSRAIKMAISRKQEVRLKLQVVVGLRTFCSAHLQHVQLQRRQEADSMAVSSAYNLTGITASSVESPSSFGLFRHRRLAMSSAHTNEHSSIMSPNASLHISLYLLDGSRLQIAVPKMGTIRELCLRLRDQLGLTEDADYSVFLRIRELDGSEAFLCLPDAMPIEEADAAACTLFQALDLIVFHFFDSIFGQ